MLAGADNCQQFVPKASRTTHLSGGFGGGVEFFGSGSHLSRRGVERVDLRALLLRQAWGRRIESEQTDYSKASQQRSAGE
jgi:hypothetical protein